MQVAASLMIASVGSMIFGSSRSSTRTSPAEYMTTPRIWLLLSFLLVSSLWLYVFVNSWPMNPLRCGLFPSKWLLSYDLHLLFTRGIPDGSGRYHISYEDLVLEEAKCFS